MIEPFSPRARGRTLLLLGAVVVLAVAAGVVGIADNPIGVSLAMLSAACFVLAFVHVWRTSVRFRRLIYAGLLGIVVFLVVGVGLQVLVERTGMPAAVDRFLGAVGLVFIAGAAFLCVPAIVVGAVGAILMRRRERKPRPAA